MLLRLCWRLASTRRFYSSNGLNSIYSRIKATGPLTVAEYMKECLLNPLTGYYVKQNVLGGDGDFITSPEISQVFGELLGVWIVADWIVQGSPSHCQVIELGPGQGSLMKDILRVFEQIKQILPAVSIHLVEASYNMISRQKALLTDSTEGNQSNSLSLSNGISINWYSHLTEVPQGFSYYIAHEFFDVLPVHQFKMTESGWREVLVDIDPQNRERRLRFVLSPHPTPASLTYTALLSQDNSIEGEVCPDGLVIVEEIARRIKRGGGAALIADYGDNRQGKLTLRGYRNHGECDVLSEPGLTDLTADVNFNMLQEVVRSQGCVPHGPITQNEFLHKMCIRERLQVLLDKADPVTVRSLTTSYEWLTNPDKMGERFKFMAVTNSSQHIPTPF